MSIFYWSLKSKILAHPNNEFPYKNKPKRENTIQTQLKENLSYCQK